MNIAMLISGGVDSSVALRLLLDAGYTVRAFYLKIWLEDELAFLGECPWEDDLKYVRAVCEQAGVPLEVVPFQREYWNQVVSYTIAEVKAGRTPNPDVLCNAQIKFGAFYEYLSSRKDISFDKIATGHYAQVEEVVVSDDIFSSSEKRTGKLSLPEIPEAGLSRSREISQSVFPASLLKMSPDKVKDQTYFLSQLSQEQLTKACFPIGHLQKEEVRTLAEKYHLPNAKRKDSQGICFLGKVAFDQFLEFHLGKRSGDIIDLKTGEKISEHDGFWFYTIGQRRGIKLSGGPWFVVKKDAEKNVIFVSNQYRSEDMFRDTFEVGNLHWISGSTPVKNMLSVKLRHGEKLYACEVSFRGNGTASVKLIDEEDRGIAPGQFAVFYDGEYCLGGGVIL
jgi:tRNA-specific 2-thiouridylase